MLEYLWSVRSWCDLEFAELKQAAASAGTSPRRRAKMRGSKLGSRQLGPPNRDQPDGRQTSALRLPSVFPGGANNWQLLCFRFIRSSALRPARSGGSNASLKRDPIGPCPSQSERRCSDKSFLAMSLENYWELLDCSARQVVLAKRRKTPENLSPVRKRLELGVISCGAAPTNYSQTATAVKNGRSHCSLIVCIKTRRNLCAMRPNSPNWLREPADWESIIVCSLPFHPNGRFNIAPESA